MLGWAPWDESNATCQTQRFLWMIARHHPTTFMEQAEASSHFLLFFFLSDIQSMRDEAHTGIAEASTCFRTSLLQNIILFTSLSTFFPLVLDFPHLWVPVYQWPYWILVVCHTDPVWRAAPKFEIKEVQLGQSHYPAAPGPFGNNIYLSFLPLFSLISDITNFILSIMIRGHGFWGQFGFILVVEN